MTGTTHAGVSHTDCFGLIHTEVVGDTNSPGALGDIQQAPALGDIPFPAH